MCMAAAGRVLVIALMILCGTARATIYVSTAGNDASDGLSWTTAKQTAQAGLNAAAAGDQVWVAMGTYVERITLKSGVALYGGFAGTETDLAQRNWVTNVTVLDGSQGGSVVTALSGTPGNTRVDGFTIRNGNGTLLDSVRCGGGVYCKAGALIIASNTITGNTAYNGAGIYAGPSSLPVITGNTITGNSTTTSGYGGGIYCTQGSPTITNNTITGNGAYVSGGGIYTDSSATVANNAVTGNAGGGVFCGSITGLSSTVRNNTIAANSGDGITASFPVTIVNNTIVGNSGVGISCLGSPAVLNTIVAFNVSGIKAASAAPSLRNNCVYGNTTYDYFGVSDPTGTNGNIASDPQLASVAYGNAHIQPGSPCIDAGNGTVVQAAWVDMDGQPLNLGAKVDIGADESDGTVWSAGPNTIVRVSSSGDDANDGSSWTQPKRTVQAAINAAATVRGDVWVQAGIYLERISLRNYAHVYGGFAGTESLRSQRNRSANVTILDGSKGGSVVTAMNLGCQVATLDGFTVRNGNGTVSGTYCYGGGIYCQTSSPLITNNSISGSTAIASSGGEGGGVYCLWSYPTIAGNTITHNAASTRGGGIQCNSSSPLIVNNMVTDNSAIDSYDGSGGAISCEYNASPLIDNNTITGNAAVIAGGIYKNNSVPVIANSIIAFNSSGVYFNNGSSGPPTFRCNCVYGNDAYDYLGADLTGTDGNISVDPKLASIAYGNMHLQPGSPCIGAGDNSIVRVSWMDWDGQARILGTRVDIGADESDGTEWPAGPSVIVRVSPNGDDAHDGSSWNLAKRTVQAGIDAAAAIGGDVWVRAGTYTERITLRAYAHIYGGFAGAETQRMSRDWTANVAVLDGSQAGNVVTAKGFGPGVSTVDGLTVRNGSAGIYCSYASPTIANNIITATTGGAISCTYSFPFIQNNRITENSGRGIYCSGASPTIMGNLITGNGSSGIYCTSSSSPKIRNNTISGNSVSGQGAGIYCNASAATIANNTITINFASSYGGGIYCSSSPAPTIRNNAIVGNSAADGGGIYCSSSSPTISNTIIAFNSSGIRVASGAPTLRYNCAYGNTAFNFSGLTDPTGINGNISVDPLLARLPNLGADDYGDLHLAAGSPCVNAGDPAYVPAAGETDMDGQPRIIGGRVDIGADEFWWAGDGNYDGFVNVGDLQLLVAAWGTQKGDAAYNAGADANGDGFVNVSDLQLLVGNWGR